MATRAVTSPLAFRRRIAWRPLLDYIGSPHRRLACWLLGAHLPYEEAWPPFCCNCHRRIR